MMNTPLSHVPANTGVEAEASPTVDGMDPSTNGTCTYCMTRPFTMEFPDLREVLEDNLACCLRCLETQGVFHTEDCNVRNMYSYRATEEQAADGVPLLHTAMGGQFGPSSGADPELLLEHARALVREKQGLSAIGSTVE